MSVTRLCGWGRWPVVEGEERLSTDLTRITEGAVLTRGLGRSYGDASLPPVGAGPVAGSRLADRVLDFDLRTGVLRAEAGLSLRDLQARALPQGWSSPVLPGTQYVTLGGMVAADVHGKNHHVAGCFGAHVRSLRMRVADGRILQADAESEPELFDATLGGMGLTGHLLEVECQLERIPTPWIWRESEAHGSLEELVAALREASAEWPFTMAWADCLRGGPSLGRGILVRGRWARPEEAPPDRPRPVERLSVPFDLPGLVLNRASMRVFNALYFRLHRRARRGVVHPQPFFHPLDAVLHWNRIYGRRGFVQYQCVLPVEDDPAVLRRLFTALSRHGACFLSVVKDCGPEGRGLLSFPRPGVSVALDVPMRGARTRALVDALNEIVVRAGGRIYLAKDALTRPEHFRAMEPRLAAWQQVRRKWDPEGRIRSALGERLLEDAA